MNISTLLENQIPLLDPHGFTETSIVSHAHSDHVAFNPYSKNRTIICSFETGELIKYKTKETNLKLITLDYFQKTKLNSLIKNIDEDIFITLYPAGHILGASQILIETKTKFLLYSGDFKLRKNITGRDLIIPSLDKQIDFLIMESTFGKPKYIFPNLETIQKQIIDFCNNSLDSGFFPIIYAYSLGKSQEIIKMLENSGLNIIVHGAIFNISNIYKQLGVELPHFIKYKKEYMNSSALEKRSVLIIPPHFAKNRMITNIPNRKTAIATGWAIDNSSKYIYKTDESFPLSDHADYNELVEYARKVNAKKTLITHGFAMNLAKDLNKLGLNAEPLDTYNPIQLF